MPLRPSLRAQRSNPGFSRRSLADFVAPSPLGFAERYETGVANGSTELLVDRWSLTMTGHNPLYPFTSVAPTARAADRGPRSKGAGRGNGGWDRRARRPARPAGANSRRIVRGLRRGLVRLFRYRGIAGLDPQRHGRGLCLGPRVPARLQPAPAVLGVDLRRLVHGVSARRLGLRDTDQPQRRDRPPRIVEADRPVRSRRQTDRRDRAAAVDAVLHVPVLQI